MGMGMVAVSCVVGPAVMNRAASGGLLILRRRLCRPGLSRQCVSIRRRNNNIIRTTTTISSFQSSSSSSPFYSHHHHLNNNNININNTSSSSRSMRSRSRLTSSFRAHSSHHHVNDSGSIDSPLISSMHSKIKEQLKAESVTVKDAYGDGRHVSIDVISSIFEGESAVSRQRMVYKAIWEELQNTVHAVDQMTTKTPSEAAAANK